ncbi:MAG: helix-turn-helix transcriptional regulator, partial [Rhodospirillaceae bacterium]|nr:helix-turn-helix transcriptional regulator [Rhodospirillaceae bacterium]
MATRWRQVASGPGWEAGEVVCDCGPHDRPFEERHDGACIAAVLGGSFQYRCDAGTAVLGPGALLLGNAGAAFECAHEYGVGDRCLAFHFAPDLLESIVAAVPGVRRAGFTVPRLPPAAPIAPLVAAAEAACDDGDAAAVEELALRLAGAVVGLLADASRAAAPSRRDARRVSRALRRIEAEAHEPLTLAGLAREAAMSPYHFLRTFRRVAGMTPHQYVLHTRLHRAAVRLRESDGPVSAIAYEVGFNDLSTFNRRFRRVMGASPSAWRAGAVAAHARRR